MTAVFVSSALFLAAFALMEGVAWTTHRYVMHGVLWCWHRSHHEPRRGLLELNDLFFVVFAAPAIALIWLGAYRFWPALPAGLGITAYGGVYLFFHDGLTHRRFPLPVDGKSGFWRPRVQAHRLHHAVSTKHGCVSFGFLLAPPARTLKRRLQDAAARAPAA